MSSVDDDLISRRLRDFPEIDDRVREIPPEIASDWPGARRVSLALGDALELRLPPSPRNVKRLNRASSRLIREPEVQEAAQRAVVIAKRWDALTEERDRDDRRRLTFERQARLCAAAHRFAYISPRDARRLLVSYFAAEYRGEEWSPPVLEAITVFVNPLADAPLSAVVPPGHILIDLTHATREDWDELGNHLRAMQRRLHYRNQPGGRPKNKTLRTEEWLRGKLPRIFADWDYRHGRKPTNTELAEEIGVSPSTLRRYRKRFPQVSF